MKRKGIVTGIVIVIVIALVWFAINKFEDTNTINTSRVEIKNGSTNSPNYTEESIIPIKQGYVTLYHLPKSSGPNSILVDSNGTVWSIGSFSHDLYSINPVTGKVRIYDIPSENDTADRMSWSMIQDRHGFIWFDQFGSHPLWRFDPSSGKFLAFGPVSGIPFQMKYNARTDEIWFTTLSNNTIGVIQPIKNGTSPTGYQVKEFSAGRGSYTSGLTFRGGSIWVTELELGKIAEFLPLRDSSGDVIGIKKELEIPHYNGSIFSSPTDIMFTGNNTVWVTEHGPSTITRYDLTSGSYTRFIASPNLYHVSALPFWMREGLDGSGIWFNEHEGGRMAFLDNESQLTEFDVGQNSSHVVFILNMALDPTNVNRAWFSEWNRDVIGMADRSIAQPFTINSSTRSITLDPEAGKKNAMIEATLEKSNSTSSEEIGNKLYLSLTSSFDPDGSFENMTGIFSQNVVDMSKYHNPINIKLDLRDQSLVRGNYTIGICAENTWVAKTIFFNLTVK